MKSKICFAIVLAAVLTLLFCACKGNKNGGDANATKVPSSKVTDVPTATPEPTLQVIVSTPIPNMNSSMKPGSMNSTSSPAGSTTFAPSVTGNPGDLPADSTPDPYDGFYSVMSSALYVEEKVSDGVTICFPKLKNDKISVDPYLVFASAKDNSDESYMFEFLGTTYLLQSKPEKIMMYWSAMQLSDDGYYHISNLYILVDDQYIVFGENVTSPRLPGRGFINQGK